MFKRWQTLAAALVVPDDVAVRLWSVIETDHTEPHRTYHNLSHLQAMFDCLELMTGGAMPTAVSLAVWFHDMVYDPQRSDNEEQSAQLMQTVLSQWVNQTILSEAERLIHLTKTHQCAAEDKNGRFLLDADLAILGSDRSRYQRYAQQIRQEYQHVPEEAYRVGRTAVLDHFLQMPSIYQTVYGQTHFEQQARENLAWEKAQLL